MGEHPLLCLAVVVYAKFHKQQPRQVEEEAPKHARFAIYERDEVYQRVALGNGTVEIKCVYCFHV